MVNVDLVGYGKASMAVAEVLAVASRDPLHWVVSRRVSVLDETVALGGVDVPIQGLAKVPGIPGWMCSSSMPW